MKENNLKAKYIKPWTKTTISLDFSSKLENLLNRHFNPAKPDCAWCTDITYIWTQEDGFVYLTSVMDLFSRKIIAWVLTKTMEAEEVLRCIETAKERRNIKNPLVIQRIFSLGDSNHPFSLLPINTGITMQGISVTRQSRKNRKMMMITSTNASYTVLFTSSMEARINLVLSKP